MSINIGWQGGILSQTCGHYVHLQCQKAYLDSLKNQSQSVLQGAVKGMSPHVFTKYSSSKDSLKCPLISRSKFDTGLMTKMTGLAFTLLVRDLGDNIIQRFCNSILLFFIVIHRNTIHGGWGLAPIYNFVTFISYFLDNFLQLSNMADPVPVK